MKKTFLTRPITPDFLIYRNFIKSIFSKKIFTNNGLFHKKLELKLQRYFNLKDIALLSTGTDGLILALKSFNFSNNKEVITTPFTWVTSVNSIIMANLKPKFVDIDKDTLNINPDLIEKNINKNTVAILITHTFGNICDLRKIQKISRRNNLKVIYDASHCFGVKSIKSKNNFYNYGDASVLSLHSTKLFHTAEGGMVLSKNKKIINKIKILKNNGVSKNSYPIVLGTNSKMSELHAALGLSILSKVDSEIKKRRLVYFSYKTKLKGKVIFQKRNEDFSNNYSYMPVMLKNEKNLIKIQKKLNRINIDSRRYFYPSLNKLKFYNTKKKCPISEKISKTILCLPIYSGINLQLIKKISKIIIANNV